MLIHRMTLFIYIYFYIFTSLFPYAYVVLWERWPRSNPSLLSHLALPVVCCQPQQKSGRKQPETSTSLPLQGMLCFCEGETRKTGFKGWWPGTNSKTLKSVKDNLKENKTLNCCFHQRASLFAVAMIWLVSPVSVWRCCLPWWDTCFLVLDSKHRLSTLYAPLNDCA